MKRASRLDNTGSSLGNCEITDEQVRILISLDVEIVIALDEDHQIQVGFDENTGKSHKDWFDLLAEAERVQKLRGETGI